MSAINLPHITVALDERSYAELRQFLDHIDGARQKAIQSAVYRTAKWAQTHVARGLAKELGMKRADLVRQTRYGRVAVYKRPDSATVIVTGRRIPVFRFKARPAEPRHKNPPRNGVSWRIGKRRRTRSRRAFVAQMPSGHISVFKRPVLSKTSLPIIQLFGPSIPHVAIERPVINRIYKVEAQPVLLKNLASQVDRILQRKAVDRE